MSQKRYFITFGGPTENYHNAVKRICKEAQDLRVFHEVIGKTDLDLKNDKDFWDKQSKFIENNKRGYGYWLWKSYIVLSQLEKMNDNDILLYCDSGCHLNPNGLRRLVEYIKMVNNSEYGILSFQMEHLEHTWTKNDLFVEMNIPDEHKISGQHIATIFFVRKTENTVNLFKEYYNYVSNYHLLDDTPSITLNHSSFREHRHDQSILSLLFKKYGTVTLADETYFKNWQIDGIKFPIWATRYRNG
jgi:hypothetical protein